MHTPLETFELQEYAYPSERLNERATELDVAVRVIMRDYVAYQQDETGVLTIAVGDMANNLTGTEYQDQELALELGLPPRFQFNCGLLGSIALQRVIGANKQTGVQLVGAANGILAEMYQKYDIGHGSEPDPADRPTGYIGHVRIDGDTLQATGVGDVNIWVNGTQVIGEEKAVDTEKERLVVDLTKTLNYDAVERTQRVLTLVREFAQLGRLDEVVTSALYQMLVGALERDPNPTRQTVYRPVDDVVTPWQIRTLQNQLGLMHPWAYGAIDGTDTPTRYINTATFDTAEVDTVVIATDGSKPLEGSIAVRSMADLVAANRVYGEQGVVVLRRR